MQTTISIDLDAVGLYHRIHAIPGPIPEASRHIILRRCLPRFADLFDRHGIKSTLFVVGQDLQADDEGRAILREMAARGHELANHSHTHPYDLVRLGPARIEEEIKRSHDAIGEVAGTAPVGFRSPGYETSAPVIQALIRHGYRYDSSAFPSIPYYAAKAMVMGAMRVLRKKSGSILGSPQILRAPTIPYHPHADNPYKRGALPIIELPMAVTPWMRLPVIGTSVITAPEFVRKRLVARVLKRDFFNFEMHGIDLADTEHDPFAAALVAKQPDLRVPFEKKLAALESTIVEAKAAGATFVTLREAIDNMSIA